MFTGSIKISELDGLSAVLGRDFFPVVQSGSMTTFRVTITTLNDWMRISGSALSASWASRSLYSSLSNTAISASHASSSVSSSFSSVAAIAYSLNFTPLSSNSASWASASLSSSYSVTASFALNANQSSFATSSISSSFATSASWAPILGDTFPIGAFMAFGGTTVPPNWLECNGEAKLTSSFAELYAAISSSHISSSYGYLCDGFGNRDESGSYFKLPDFRGEFLRGWDHNRGIDLDRFFASSQTDAFRSHVHTFNQYGGNGVSGGSVAGTPPQNSLGLNPGTNLFSTNPSGDSDTRPRNIATMYCVKYSNSINIGISGVTLAGDVVGNSSTTTVVKIQNIPVTSSLPLDGQVMTYDGTEGKWHPQTPSSSTDVSSTSVGTSYLYANPALGFLGTGSSIYVINYNRYTSRRNLISIDTTTNVATYKIQWPQDASYFHGRVFRNSSDGLLHAMMFSNVDLYDYNLADNTITRQTGSGGYFNDLPVVIDWAASGSRPTVWTLQSNYLSGPSEGGDYFNVFWRRHIFTAGSWSTINGPTLDLRTIANGTEFKKFFNDYPVFTGLAQDLLVWDYNYIKKRYYLMDSSTGLLHILSQASGSMITNFDSSSISYEKTLAVPVPNMDQWADSFTDKLSIDYHPDTGEERGIFMNRIGNTALFGSMAYVEWPE